MESIKHLILNEHFLSKKNYELKNLFARIAHDIGSPIAIMEMSLSLMEENKSELSILRAAIQRIRDITNNLLDQSRENQSSKSILLYPLLEEVIALKRYEWLGKTCELTLNFVSKDVKVYGNPNEIKCILSNLLNNAIEACKSNAIIQLAVIKIDQIITLTIHDNGVGILSDKINDHLNGESTKHIGKGLGLSTAKNYMQSIGGKLLVSSKIDIGTTITLQFKSIE